VVRLLELEPPEDVLEGLYELDERLEDVLEGLYELDERLEELLDRVLLDGR
jgi:hypothetical protein